MSDYSVDIIKTRYKNVINYTYIVTNNQKKCVLIDPAWELTRYTELISAKKITPQGILLTHHHKDHSNLASTLAGLYSCAVYIDEQEAKFYNFTCDYLNTIKFEQDILQLDDITIQVLHTPGHTYGSCCYVINNYVFTGDTLFSEGCGICDIKGGDPQSMYQSLQYLKKNLAQDTLVYPGHKYKMAIGLPFSTVMQKNIYLQIDNKEDFVAFRMRDGQRGLLDFT